MSGELLRCGLNLLDEAADGRSRLCTFGDPVVDLVEIDHGIALFFGGIVSAKDVKETAITGEALVSGDNAENVMPFGTFLTETDNNSHDNLSSDFFGEADSGGEGSEIKGFFGFLPVGHLIGCGRGAYDDYLGRSLARAGISRCPGRFIQQRGSRQQRLEQQQAWRLSWQLVSWQQPFWQPLARF